MDFLRPEALWLGALAAPLLLLWILRPRRERRVVSSTLLWREALESVDARTPFKRLRRDWLLLLQLLVLAALALAAAAPLTHSWLVEGERVAIVLDASASLRAAGRFAEAKDAARGLVQRAEAGTSFALISAEASPRVLAGLDAELAELERAIDAAEAYPGPPALDESLELARGLVGEEGTLILVSDRAPSAEEREALPALREGRVRLLRVGEPEDNAGIVALSLRPADASGARHEVFVRVVNAAASPRALRLVLEHDGRVRAARELTLPAGAEEGTTLTLEAAREGVVVARLEMARDALADDDEARFVLRPPARRRALMSGRRSPALERAIAADPEWSIVRPASDGDEGATAEADIEVAVGEAPVRADLPLLWVDPAPLARERARAASALSFERSHPVLRFVDLYPLRFFDVPVLDTPPGARVLAESAAGPLIAEMPWEGRRALVWAFAPERSDLPLYAAFPLLVRGALAHLAPPRGGLPELLPAGARPRVAWPSGTSALLIAPSGREQALLAEQGALRLPPVDELGVWRLVGERVGAAEARELAFGVALLDERESALERGEGDAGAGATLPEEEARRRLAPHAIWRPLALVALGLLLLEGLGWHRRWGG